MQKEWNGVTSVYGNWAMNLSALVPHTRLWASCKTLRHHVLNILCPYFLQDVWRPKILPNCHVIQTWYNVFSSIFFRFVLRLKPKITQLTWYKRILYEIMTNDILIFKIKKNIIILFSMLSNCSVILPNPPRNIIIISISLKFRLALKIYKI